MAEPRARARTKGQVFNTSDLADLLYAYGDSTRTPSAPTSLPTTTSTLDEILTDFIIETCHAAALSASYSRRQKIKVDDFKFVLRKDERLLGRVLEQLWRERRIKDQRSLADLKAMETAAVADLEGVAKEAGVQGKEMKTSKKGKRKRKDGEEDRRGGKKRMDG